MDEVKRIQEAIEQLVERRKQRRKDARAVSEIEEEEDRLLSNLLSQFAAVKASGSRGGAAVPPPEKDELAAELRKLRRQNTVTHILLATMIIVTGTWQLSATSLILSLKNKLTDPFKSAATLFGKVLKGGGQSLTELHSLALDSNSHPMEGSILPQLTVPELRP